MAYYALKVKDGSGVVQTVGDPRTADKADKDSPALTGTPTAPTAASGTNTTQIATTAFVQSAVGSVIDAAPEALNTLNELAAALGDDANFASTVTSSLAGKAPTASPTFTGTITTPLTTAGFVKTSNAGVLSSTATVAQSDVTGLVSDLAAKAPLASPALTGTPTAPTAAGGTNTTQVATTAFVKGAVDAAVGTGTITSTNIADGTIVNADISTSAAIALSKLGTGALPTSITVASANIVNGTIVDADISASAAIAQSKVSGLTTALDSKPDLFVASTTPGSLGNGDFWLDTSVEV